MNVFISYAREDWQSAERVYNDLQQAGIPAWLDKKELLPGQNWKYEISQAIKKCSHFIALLSQNSVSKKGFFQRELKKAMDLLQEFPRDQIFLIPALLDECTPHDERIADIHWAELYPAYEEGMELILRVLKPDRKGNGTQEKQKENWDTESQFLSSVPKKDTQSVSVKTGYSEDGFPEPKYKLRKKPVTASDEEFIREFKLNENRRPLKYVENDFIDNGDGTITDRATGLVWQQSGSGWVNYEKAEAYIRELNQKRFAGYDDWRLPTVDELASLLESEKQSESLYINPIFDKKQRWCWTADRRAAGAASLVRFYLGVVYWGSLNADYSYVRAVRS